MSSDKVKAEILRSTYDSQYYALNIEDTRHGVDAGPWEIIATLTISLDDISQYKSLQQQLKEAKEELDKLIDLIKICEQERQTARLSGLETGWEHPNTRKAFIVLLRAAADAG